MEAPPVLPLLSMLETETGKRGMLLIPFPGTFSSCSKLISIPIQDTCGWKIPLAVLAEFYPAFPRNSLLLSDLLGSIRINCHLRKVGGGNSELSRRENQQGNGIAFLSSPAVHKSTDNLISHPQAEWMQFPGRVGRSKIWEAWSC